MQYVEDTVLTDADIAFYIAYTVFDARIYGCHCVFGSDGGGTRCALVRGILVVAAGRWEHPAVSRIMESNASTGFFIMGSSGDVFFFNSYKSHRR